MGSMIYLILLFVGLVLGSFVNALVWRLQAQEKAPKSKDLSILRGRSMCPHCRHTLSARDLIPVLSWLSLRGKCRYCHKPIGWQYPAVELITMGLVVASYALWPMELNGAGLVRFIFWPPLIAGFVALVVYDLRWMLLPTKIIYSLMALVTMQWLIILVMGDLTAVQLLDIFLGVLVGGGLFYAIFQVSAGKWIGGGDVRLGFLLGLIVGSPVYSFLFLFLAAAIGSLVSVPLLAIGKVTRQTRIPFGPFLLIACVVVVLFGADMVSWYERAVLLR